MADFSMSAASYNALGSFANAYIGASYAKDVASIKADTSNEIRAINNGVTQAVNSRNAVLTGMQRWAQGVRNDRVYENIGNAQEALAVNYNRARDARTRQNFSTNIKQAEESGRQQAMAAASGVTGSVVDVIDTTTRLRQGIENFARKDAERQTDYDYRRTEFNQRLALMDQLDTTLIFDNPQILDSRTNSAYVTDPFSAGIAGVGIKGFQALATDFFKTPDNGLGGLASSGSRSMGD